MPKKVTKKTSSIKGQVVEQSLEDSQFLQDWNTWLSTAKASSSLGTENSLSIYEFFKGHVLSSAGRRPGSSTQEGEGMNLVIRQLETILDFDSVMGKRQLNLLRKMHKFIDEAKGTKYDPGRIKFHEKVYKNGKLTGKRPVYGHWLTVEFAKKNEKYAAPTGEAKRWYTYGSEPAQNPPHQALYGNGGKYAKPKGLLFILEDAITEFEKMGNHLTLKNVNGGDLHQLPQVKKYLEGLMNGTYFKEGKLQGASAARALATQEFQPTSTQESALRKISGLSEEEMVGDITSFTVEITGAQIEKFYMASSKKKAGGFYIHGKTMDKRPRKEGKPIAKSWQDYIRGV